MKNQIADKKPEMIEVVFTVVDKKAISKPVKLGISDDTFYEIISGLEEDDRLLPDHFACLAVL